jgi:histidinol-phosphate phosphatase family protein
VDRDDTLIANDSLPPDAFAGVTRGDLLRPGFVRLLPGVAEGVARLRALGARIVVLTNQGGIARGHGSLRDADACHDALRRLLTPDAPRTHPLFAGPAIDAVYSCPFHPAGTDSRFADEHPWRKPFPGMFLAAAEELRIDLRRSWLVGDAARDIEAAVAADIPRSQCLLVGPRGDHPTTADALAHLASRLEQALRVVDASWFRLQPEPRPDGSSPLGDPRTAETLRVTAHALAERTGVRLLDLHVTPDALLGLVVGPKVVAMGFAAEFRRATNDWHLKRTALPLWPETPPAE